MKNSAAYINYITNIALSELIIIAILCVAGFLFFVRESEMQIVITCNSFSSYADMLEAYKTHPELDRNHDGRPCSNADYKHNTIPW